MVEQSDDWYRFDEHSPVGRPKRDMPTGGSGDRKINIQEWLDQTPKAQKFWNKPLALKKFEPGKHTAVIEKAEWRQLDGGRDYLMIIWREYASRRRGASICTPCFLNAFKEEGRTWAFRQLSLISAATGIYIDAGDFQPSVLLGGVADLTIEMKPHWSKPGEMVPTVTKYEATPEV
jgi:hypothetical protein